MNAPSRRAPQAAAKAAQRVDFALARQEQERLRQLVRLEDQAGEVRLADGKVRLVAGVDAAHDSVSGMTRAAAVLLALPGLELVDQAVVQGPTPFPYVPGYLSFREADLMVAALHRLAQRPDAVVCDGQGAAHPRGFGLACHVGVLANLPAVGVAKSRLCGEFDEPGPLRGDRAPLVFRGRVVGMVLRTRSHVKPVFVSPGHLMGLERAAELALELAPRFRLPESTRLADRLASFTHPFPAAAS